MYQNVAATTQLSTKPVLVQGLCVNGGSDVAKYELRDGDQDTSPLVLAVSAGINAAESVILPDGSAAVQQLRVVKVSGTGSTATAFFV